MQTNLEKLLEQIRDEPTDVSYDVFLSPLEEITARVIEMHENLYKQFPPRLTWQESQENRPMKIPGDLVRVHLVVKNDANYQSADSLTIDGVLSADVQRQYVRTEPANLRGGEEKEFIIELLLTDEAQRNGNFTIELQYSYRSNDDPRKNSTKHLSETFSLYVRKESFQALDNPYGKFEGGNPVYTSEMFYGRKEQIEEIVSMLRLPGSRDDMNYGRAIAVYGQARAGKSTLMYHLKGALLAEYGDKVVLWDMQNSLPGITGDEIDEAVKRKLAHVPGGISLPNFLYLMLSFGQDGIRENQVISRRVNEAGLVPPLRQILDKPHFAVPYFNDYMRRLNAILREEKSIIVLMIDEFSYLNTFIQEGKIPKSFMQFWKAMLQNNCIFAVVAGQDDTPEFMREYQNEFACMEPKKLTYLEERHAKELIREPLQVAQGRRIFQQNSRADTVDEIYRLTAGSAWLTVIVCSNLVKYLNNKGAEMVTDGILEDFLRTRAFVPFPGNGFLSDVHFHPQLQERGHREYDEANAEILLSIARLSQTTGRANIHDISCGSKTRKEILDLVTRLVDRNVLSRSGEDYEIQVKLLEKWLLQNEWVAKPKKGG